MRASQQDAVGFAQEKESWLRRALEQRLEFRVPAFGDSIPIEGQERRIAPAWGKRPAIEGDRLMLPGTDETVPATLRAFLKVLARDRLTARAHHFADRLEARIRRITLRDTRSRWGSCSAQGNLMFSWRLVMAPPKVLSYVAAHEVAHLREMSHAPAFWRIVGELMPEYREPRDWLRQNGHLLHRFGFEIS